MLISTEVLQDALSRANKAGRKGVQVKGVYQPNDATGSDRLILITSPERLGDASESPGWE